MRIGVNYVPSGPWFHSWIDFDEDRLRQDLKNIKKIGADHIRAHLMWHYFQPNENYLSTTCLKNLEKFTAICAEEKIDFFLSLFTGFMSGIWFIPPWAKGEHKLLAQKPEYIQAEKRYIQGISAVVAKSPAFLGFDLGNELTCFIADEKDYQDAWAREMFAVCEEYAPGKLHNNGVDHQPWFANTGFSREALANDGAITPLHCWCEFTGARKRNGGEVLNTDCTNVAPFMAELARAYAKNPQRKIWIQEIGIAKTWEPDLERRIAFMDQTFQTAAEIENLWGITWWCSHDITKQLRGYNELEYELGLIDCENRIKPEGAHFAALSEKYRDFFDTDKKQETKIVLQEKENYDGWDIGEQYMNAVQNGEKPKIVLVK